MTDYSKLVEYLEWLASWPDYLSGASARAESDALPLARQLIEEYKSLRIAFEEELECCKQRGEENERLKGENAGLRGNLKGNPVLSTFDGIADLQARLREMEEENEGLKKDIAFSPDYEEVANEYAETVKDLQARLSAVEDERDRLQEALERIARRATERVFDDSPIDIARQALEGSSDE